jgi:hypothetical protein
VFGLVLVFIGFTATEVEAVLTVEAGVEFFFFYAVVACTFGCGLWSGHFGSSFIYILYYSLWEGLFNIF